MYGLWRCIYKFNSILNTRNVLGFYTIICSTNIVLRKNDESFIIELLYMHEYIRGRETVFRNHTLAPYL